MSRMYHTKVEGLEFAFEGGDIVLAKCEGNFPEPAVVQCFRGYDKDGFEIYKVKFIIGDHWAYIPQFYLQHLSFSNIRDLVNIYEDNEYFVSLLLKAEKKLQNYGQNLVGKSKERFYNIFVTQSKVNMDFFLEKAPLHQPKNVVIPESHQQFQFFEQLQSSHYQHQQPSHQQYQSSQPHHHSQHNGILSQNSQSVQKKDEMVPEPQQSMHQSPQQKKFKRCTFNNFMEYSIEIASVDTSLAISTSYNGSRTSYIEDKLKYKKKKKSKKNISIIAEPKVLSDEKLSTYSQVLARNLELVQHYLNNSHVQKGYKLQQSSTNGRQEQNLNKIETKIKTTLNFLDQYQISEKQLNTLLENISPFLYNFIENHIPKFILSNKKQIKELARDLVNKKYTFRRVPILNLLDYFDDVFTEWLKQIELEQEPKNMQTSSNKIKERSESEKVHDALLQLCQKYESSMRKLRQFILK